MFKRKIYSRLLEWKNTSNGRTALLIEGPRRVGKSTIVREFAGNEYESCIVVDFYEAPAEVISLFDDLSNLNFIFLQLQLIYHVSLRPRKSVIVFEDVQLCPRARQAIKALVEDGRYDYIETGSLISIRKNVRDILIPSEERKIRMCPMDFEEFCWALGDEVTVPMLRELYAAGHSLGQAAHRRVMRDFRLYMLVGGMPQAVDSYLRFNDLSATDRVKRDILRLYEDDFFKIDPSGRLSLLFDSIPSQLNSNASRYQVSGVLPGSRADDILEKIAELRGSGIVLVSYHANDPGTGMLQHRNLARFKLFAADTGLFVTLMFKDRDFTDNIIYSKLLNDRLQSNLGYLYENIVAQMLDASGHSLFYHTFANDVSRHNYEIDFLISDGSRICPVEVKSSGYRRHAALDAFTARFRDRISRRVVAYTKDYFCEGGVEFLPVYMLQFL